ncbi:MAG: GntR family transcriptional regulator [Propionibacteriales bacterium]|nr:GntR family transcriptional regulator [Propionibacteriales bacterium]
MSPRIERLVLVDQIATSIRDDILHGRLRPGQRVMVAALAKELGVSHIPVREAIRRLEAESLITTVPHRSTVVADVRLGELHEIYDLRRLIEGDTVTRAASAYRDEDLVTIDAAIARLLGADPEDLEGDFWDAHKAFHWAVLQPAMDPWRQRLLGQLWQSAERYHRMFTLVFGSLADAHAEHKHLAEAAHHGDPEQMRTILTTHLHHTESTVVAGYLASLEQGAADEAAPTADHEAADSS